MTFTTYVINTPPTQTSAAGSATVTEAVTAPSGSNLISLLTTGTAGDSVWVPGRVDVRTQQWIPPIFSDTYSFQNMQAYAYVTLTAKMPSSYTVNAGDTVTANTFWTTAYAMSGQNSISGPNPDHYSASSSGSFSTTGFSGGNPGATITPAGLTGYPANQSSASSNQPTSPLANSQGVTLSVGTAGPGGTYVATFQCPITTWNFTGGAATTPVGNPQTSSDQASTSITGSLTLAVTSVTLSGTH